MRLRNARAAFMSVAACSLLWAAPVAANGAAGVPSQSLRPRVPFEKPATIVKPDHPSLLTVKFRDDLRVRTIRGGLTSEAGAGLYDARAVRTLHGLTFEQQIRLPQNTLEFLESRAAANSGLAQPDLAGILVVSGPDDALEQAARELLALDSVEWVEFAQLFPEPPCSDISPDTPSYFDQGLQGYHGPDPGLDMTYAWTLGARGQGIQIADCEYGWIPGTEDLCGVVNEPGQTVHPSVAANGWDNHGTATLGEVIGLDNDYGITGLAPDASALFFPEWSVEDGGRRVTAITNAIAASSPGDVVMLEMQTNGAGGGYGPAELNNSVWTVTKTGTDAGVVVVGAAGNGNQNLDSSPYVPYMDRGDSGAIIVGAGSSSTSHSKLSFSTYGSRVDVQGWGGGVFTLGYGDYAELDNDTRQRYTSGFSGTSSATPFVVGCVAVLQSLAEQTHGCRMEPRGVRQLLIDTGIPQGSGGEIGPFPDMQAAADALVAGAPDCSYGCGNDLREGAEQCDGSDTGSCGGACASDCSCLPRAPGEVGQVVVTQYAKLLDRMSITYTPACGSSDNTVVYGPLEDVSTLRYTGQVCGIGNSGVHGPFGLGAPGESYFFLVVANDGDQVEGSYGTNGTAQERPGDEMDPVCSLTQNVGFSCD